MDECGTAHLTRYNKRVFKQIINILQEKMAIITNGWKPNPWNEKDLAIKDRKTISNVNSLLLDQIRPPSTYTQSQQQLFLQYANYNSSLFCTHNSEHGSTMRHQISNGLDMFRMRTMKS